MPPFGERGFGSSSTHARARTAHTRLASCPGGLLPRPLWLLFLDVLALPTNRSRVPAAGLRGLASCCDARPAGLDHAPPQAAAKKSHMGSRSSVDTGLVFSTSKNVCLGRSNHGCHAFTFRAVARRRIAMRIALLAPQLSRALLPLTRELFLVPRAARVDPS